MFRRETAAEQSYLLACTGGVMFPAVAAFKGFVAMKGFLALTGLVGTGVFPFRPVEKLQPPTTILRPSLFEIQARSRNTIGRTVK